MSADHADLIAEARALREDWDRAQRPFSGSNFDMDESLAVLHATGRAAVLCAQQLADTLGAQPAPHHAPRCDNCDYMEGIDEGMKMRSASLVVDSREALMEVLNAAEHAPMEFHHPDTGECVQCPWPVHALGAPSIADALLASGVVSLAADRDRLVAEQCAQIAEHPTWHPLGRLNDVEHVTAVRIAAAIRAYGAESEGE